MGKNNLLFKDEYSWTTIAPDDPSIRGNTDNKMFNRREGYEVLYLINQVAEEMKLRKLFSYYELQYSYYELEYMIRKRLPSNIRSRSKVKAWLKHDFKNFHNYTSRYEYLLKLYKV